jgi:hypothetical protein
MRKSWLLCVLLGTLAWGQAAPSAPPPAQAAPAPMQSMGSKPAPVDTSASVPPTAVVITVNGVCPPAPKTSGAKGAAATKAPATKTSTADCKTTVTKAEFEKLANALSPNVTPQLRRQLAGLLPRLIALSDEAKKEGLDKTPDYAESLKFVKMQVLSNELQRKVQKQAAEVPDSEIAKYYKDNIENFTQYNVDRIFVPKTKQGDNEAKEDDEKDQKLSDDEKKAKEAAEKTKADEAEQSMTKMAEDLRARAAKGEDFAKLQKEAYDAAGMKIESPNVNLPSVRRTGLPPAHASVLDLKPGEVSPVISDTGGHYIYKVNSKTEMTLDQAKNEIHNKLQNDRTREMMEKLNKSFTTETNEAYFGPAGAGPAPPGRMPRPRPGMAPPSGQPQAPPPAQPPAQQPN